ncbi:hypothetical protein A1F94_002617 [Pyrenophora tritici-repentis]|nr:hypothetical protein A1F94_002617 [Pyrenophora tritici-repentis]
MQAQGMGAMGNFTSPQANGFLAADYGGGMMNNGMGALNLAQFGLAGAGTNDGHGFLGDNIDRGRSPPEAVAAAQSLRRTPLTLDCFRIFPTGFGVSAYTSTQIT